MAVASENYANLPIVGEAGGIGTRIRDVGCHLIDIPFRTLGLKYPKDAECSVMVFTRECGVLTIIRRMSTIITHNNKFDATKKIIL